MEKQYITTLCFGDNSLEHLFAVKVAPVERITIRYKNKGAVNGYIKANTKNGKSGLDFRHRVCYNEIKGEQMF